MKEYYHENIGGYRDRILDASRRRYVEDHPGHLDRNARYGRRHPEKVRAKEKVNQEIRMGRMARQPCRVCGGEPAQAAHNDYSKPLDVTWLCRKHLFERIRLINRKTPPDRWPDEWPADLRRKRNAKGGKAE